MPTNQADTAQPRTRETVGPAIGGAYLDAVATRTTAYAAWLWVAAIATLFADGALTVYGIHLGLTELNPVASDIIAQVGIVPALALLKGSAVGIAAGGWVVIADDYRGLVPAGLTLPWALATGINVVVIGVTLVG